MPVLRTTFSYASYWLNNPPGESRNSWSGKREVLRGYGFGFLVLFTGHTDAEIKAAGLRGESPEALGAADGKAATAAAAREGFAKDILIFLDQEEGGRLLPEQAAYLFGWVETVQESGARAGVYCSGIDVPESDNTISTARDIVERESAREQLLSKSNHAEHRVALWIANDECPPAPGCVWFPPSLESGIPGNLQKFVTVWQYVQSPRRARFSASCPQNVAANGNCYAPGLPENARIFVDLDTAHSPDPSEDSH